MGALQNKALFLLHTVDNTFVLQQKLLVLKSTADFKIIHFLPGI